MKIQGENDSTRTLDAISALPVGEQCSRFADLMTKMTQEQLTRTNGIPTVGVIPTRKYLLSSFYVKYKKNLAEERVEVETDGYCRI